ncbi:MAG: hypothetical protein SFT81_06865 [Candidatus Caenarcaniphilales bacterium]|nr:hypothetical protein [Candidatus Caenarcaniphilales bacterium]
MLINPVVISSVNKESLRDSYKYLQESVTGRQEQDGQSFLGNSQYYLWNRIPQALKDKNLLKGGSGLDWFLEYTAHSAEEDYGLKGCWRTNQNLPRLKQIREAKLLLLRGVDQAVKNLNGWYRWASLYIKAVQNNYSEYSQGKNNQIDYEKAFMLEAFESWGSASRNLSLPKSLFYVTAHASAKPSERELEREQELTMSSLSIESAPLADVDFNIITLLSCNSLTLKQSDFELDPYGCISKFCMEENFPSVLLRSYDNPPTSRTTLEVYTKPYISRLTLPFFCDVKNNKVGFCLGEDYPEVFASFGELDQEFHKPAEGLYKFSEMIDQLKL